MCKYFSRGPMGCWLMESEKVGNIKTHLCRLSLGHLGRNFVLLGSLEDHLKLLSNVMQEVGEEQGKASDVCSYIYANMYRV